MQREVIAGWALARGARVLSVFEELDESGRRADRPLLEEALQRVERGISHGIVVARVTRFGRSLVSGIAALERIDVAGGRFVAVQNGLDTSTDTGRLVLHILLSLAEWDSERIGAEWAEARARAVARGVYVHPGAPVGYRRTRTGRLRPHAATASVIVELFGRRAEGETLASLARWLEAEGIHTANGHPGWTASALRCLLGNRAYLGEIHDRASVNDQGHPSLVDAATWEAAQSPRRAAVAHRRDRRLLARLVRCAGCSLTMSPYWHPPAGARAGRASDVVYTCNRHSAAGHCPAPTTIAARYLEAYVEECFFELLARRRREPATDLDQAEGALRSAALALRRYRDSDHILARLGVDAYLAGVSVRTERVRTARLHLAALRDAHFIHTLPATKDLERRWIDMNDNQRRALIARVIDCVFVSPGPAPVEDRVTICPAGTAPPPPRTGKVKVPQAHRFAPQARHRWPTPKPWPAARIERELNAYLDGQDQWPSADQFETDGRRRLHEQIVRHAGVKGWAHHLGLSISDPRPEREPWTVSRIHAALDLYLRGKQRWPTEAEFHADGLTGLHRAIRNTGSVARWRAQVGEPHTRPERNG